MSRDAAFRTGRQRLTVRRKGRGQKEGRGKHVNIEELQANWEAYGQTDPLWAVLTYAGKQGNKWEPEEFFGTGREEITRDMTYLDSLGISIERGKALDFGCAVGRLTQALAEHFESVVGVDIAPSMVELARHYNTHGSRCQYYVNDKDNLTLFPDASFDFILSIITLQHMEPRYSRTYLREFLRLLKPGGVALFQMPDEMRASYRKRRRLKRFVPSAILCYYRKIRYGTPFTDHQNNSQPDNSQPVMEMYGIAREELVAFIDESGGRVLAVREDENASDWRSFLYCVTRR